MQIGAQMNDGPNLEGVTILVVILLCRWWRLHQNGKNTSKF